MQSYAFGLLQHLCDPDKHAIADAGVQKRWSEKLDEWRRGVPQTYPLRCRLPFLFETAGFTDPLLEVYEEAFVECASLPRRADAGPFLEHIARSTDRWATAFPNMSGDTRLVIPMPVAGLEFATMKDFADSASFEHQQHFWRRVAQEVDRWLQMMHLRCGRGGDGIGAEKVYISTHGHGVAYFHVRICSTPKYYQSKHLM